jgi:hypothetical protein
LLPPQVARLLQHLQQLVDAIASEVPASPQVFDLNRSTVRVRFAKQVKQETTGSPGESFVLHQAPVETDVAVALLNPNER